MDTASFKIERWEPGGKTSRCDLFSVPLNPGMTVLEGLIYIQERLDGSLAFRTSCRAGVCGSCAMYINGSPRLACETQISALHSDLLTVRPLPHFEVLRDLVVDLTPFWDAYERIKPYLIPGSPPSASSERIQTIHDRERLVGLFECILCACCYSACTITGTNPSYPGPASLLKVYRFFADSRDNGTPEREREIDDPDGIWRCHTIFGCQEVCPKELDPTGAISRLKRDLVKRRIKDMTKG